MHPDTKRYLELLDLGIDYWNRWRIENPEARPRLSAANLTGRDLAKLDLHNALLDHTTLTDTLLQRANLSGAVLNKADLTDASLESANLDKASLRECNLERTLLLSSTLVSADLRDSVCKGTNFVHADLESANLEEVDAEGANFDDANLERANLRRSTLHFSTFKSTNCIDANFREASAEGTNFANANLYGADLSDANFPNSIFSGANLNHANLQCTSLNQAKLSGSQLRFARMIQTDLKGADVSGCWIYGLSVWGIDVTDAKQTELMITRENEPKITVDNLEIAQFVYLLLDNQRIRDIITTITTKVVLILGRFTPERKKILDGIRAELRKCDYIPVIFDFDAPTTRTLTDTISVLAHMARFVIADITDAKSIPQELQRIVPNLPLVPVQPLLKSSEREYGMFDDFRRYPWVLPVFEYHSEAHLLSSLRENIVRPAEQKARNLQGAGRVAGGPAFR